MSDQHHDSTPSIPMSTKPQYPLHQIAETPTHKLLLKQWLKEQDIVHIQISLKESQIDGVRKEITNLYTLFFLFHSFSVLLLFSFSPSASLKTCKNSWLPCLCSLLCSAALICAVRYKIDVESHLQKLLQRKKEDAKMLGMCVDELKKKGADFDLLKEVDALRRAKSLRIEPKEVRKWSAKVFASIFLFGVSCLVLAVTRVILCG